MSEVQISQERLRQLQEITDKRQLTLDEFVDEIIQSEAIHDIGAGGFQRLAEAADQWNFHSGDPYIVDRLEELLKTEYTAHLLNRMNHNDAASLP